MKSTTFPLAALAVSALLGIGSAAAADYRCDRDHLTRVDATACAKAAEGLPSLRQYVTRTKSIYDLQMRDFVPLAKQPDRFFGRSDTTGGTPSQFAAAPTATAHAPGQPK